MRADNSRHVIGAAARRSQDSHRRVLAVLHDAQAQGERPTVTDVARAAGASRAHLYAQPELIAAVRQLQDANTGRPRGVPTGQRASHASLLARVEALNARNKALREENRLLRRRLEAAHGQLREATGPKHT